MKIAWFSAGITSAVACKLALEQYSDVEIYYIETGAAHEDNKRFIAECENWYSKKINIVKNQGGYKNPIDVVLKTRYVNGVNGAPCTLALKKQVRFDLEEYFRPNLFDQNRPTIENQIFGFEFVPKEVNRAIRFIEQYPSAKPLFPLIESKINKKNSAALLMKAGIELPEMYKQGYQNNNCIGCVKGGKGYWNKIRVDYPEHYQRMAEAERVVGNSCIKGAFLDELNPVAGRKLKPIVPDCGSFCELEFTEIMDPRTAQIMKGKLSITEIKQAA